MQKGSVVLINFTGKELSTGRIFDTTDEKIAKDQGIWREDSVYKPMPIVVGKGEIIKGIDEELEKMSEGEEKTIVIPPAKAFGERNPNLVRVVPLNEFIKRKITPFPGLIVDINGLYGKVQTISGGRVRIDFNPELAGKNVEYKIKIVKELKTVEERAQAFAEKFFPLKEGKPITKVSGDKLTIEFEKPLPKELEFMKEPFKRYVSENLPSLKSVEFKEIVEEDKKEDKQKTEHTKD